MKISRRDFLKVLGVSALPLLNLNNILRDEKEFDIIILTSKPVESLTEILKAVNSNTGKNIFVHGINKEAENVLKFSLNRINKGVYKGSKIPILATLSGKSIMSVVEVRRISSTEPGLTLTYGSKVVDPRKGVFSSVSKKIYSEKSAAYEIKVKVNSTESSSGKKGEKAKVSINGKTYGYLDLKKNTSITLPTNLGKIKVATFSGKVRVEESSCKHKICMHRGFISSPGERLICAPQKVVVEIVGKSMVDAIVG